MPNEQLARAVQAGIITALQAEQLAAFFAPDAQARAAAPAAAAPRFDLAHVLWYLGALIIMGAMGLFSTLAFSLMGSPALLATAVFYGAGAIAVGNRLWSREGLRTPGGLLITVAVSMAPLAIYALQDMAGWWAGRSNPGSYQGFFQWIKGGFVPMEVGTIIASLVALRFYRFPFILFVTAVMLWFLSMDVADWLRGIDGWSSFQTRQTVSMAFGLVLIPIAWIVDLKRRDQDFGFWLHFVGILTFWGGLSLQGSDNELSKLIYCLFNVGLIGFAVFLGRRVYAVFGGMGVMFYTGHLAYKVFKNSLLFPFALSALGLAIIGVGLYYYRNAARLNAWLETSLPPALLRLRPAVRG